jgi:hypothetical protein
LFHKETCLVKQAPYFQDRQALLGQWWDLIQNDRIVRPRLVKDGTLRAEVYSSLAKDVTHNTAYPLRVKFHDSTAQPLLTRENIEVDCSNPSCQLEVCKHSVALMLMFLQVTHSKSLDELIKEGCEAVNVKGKKQFRILHTKVDDRGREEYLLQTTHAMGSNLTYISEIELDIQDTTTYEGGALQLHHDVLNTILYGNLRQKDHY